mmetsp:Transcript_25920/g.64915  ORF Transcript_25920/g.64915 Transcript_25920/m.64915 type:complete len:82 (-) Transcript_25920:588-833(-)
MCHVSPNAAAVSRRGDFGDVEVPRRNLPLLTREGGIVGDSGVRSPFDTAPLRVVLGDLEGLPSTGIGAEEDEASSAFQCWS